jgi:teichuronic acid biosynthesis glycosyltransferase TuaG
VKKIVHRDKTKPRISVIIPTWNREKTIKKAINSALKQTFQVFEILVCDDGSTDNTEKIVKSINNPKIIWVPGERGGCPAIPRNRGLKLVKGDWIAFLDSDDEWLPEKIERQFQLIKKTGSKACSSNALRRIPRKGILGNYLSLKKNKITFENLLKGNEIITSSLLTEASLIKIIGNFPEDKILKTLEDYSFWLRLTTQTDVAFIRDPLIIYNDDAKNTNRGKENISGPDAIKLVIGNFFNWAKDNKMSKGYVLLTKAKKELEAVQNECEKKEEEIKILKQELESSKKQIEGYKNSYSYRLGNFLLYPLKLFQKK